MPCSYCNKVKVFSRGYCQACYYRLRRRGTLERAYVINGGVCLAAGCGKPAFAKNLCGYHYRKARPPLWTVWTILRSRHPKEIPASWSRFDSFVADVGQRPSEQHQLRRIDAAKPFSKENARWLTPIHQGKRDSMTKEARREYGRAWALARNYGLTIPEAEAMIASHGNKCAICKQPETRRAANGKPTNLCVDHDHKGTKKVRGLLCVHCNTVIGKRGADDSIEILRAAIAYLELHSATEGKTP